MKADVPFEAAVLTLHDSQVMDWPRPISHETLDKASAFSYDGVVNAEGSALIDDLLAKSPLIVDVRVVNSDLLDRLRLKPEAWLELRPRQFEEAVAEVLIRMGYDVTLTPESRDGGFDMFAARKDGLGEFLYLVECKRYVPPNRVGVHVVRALNGVREEHRATAAAVVTTSYFTKGAKEYQAKFEKTMKLHDYLALQQWLAAVRGT
jgi:restriction system protein